MALESGSSEYYRLKEHAERLYRGYCDANSTTGEREWLGRMNRLADMMREEYGFSDSSVEYIIDTYYLDRRP